MTMGTLTRNFSRAEFDRPEPYPADAGAQLVALAALAQWLRDLAGSPGIVTSTWRSPARNAAIGGAPHSQHLTAAATDVVFPLVPLRTLAARVLAAIDAGDAPDFGQLIFYTAKGHVHVSLPDPALLGDREGTVFYSPGADDAGRDLFAPLTDAAQLPLLSDPQYDYLALLGLALVLAALAIADRRGV